MTIFRKRETSLYNGVKKVILYKNRVDIPGSRVSVLARRLNVPGRMPPKQLKRVIRRECVEHAWQMCLTDTQEREKPFRFD